MFSIIIPVGPGRNAEAALSSLLKAGLNDGDEVIVVADGHTLKIGSRFSMLPLRLINLPKPEGANAARNLGAHNARNEILCFLDDDDAYQENCLPVIRQEFNRLPQVDAWVLNWRMKSGTKFFLMLYPKIITERKIWKRNLAGGASSMVVRKAAFEAVKGFDVAMASMQDWDLWLRLSRQFTIQRIAQPLVVYNDVGADRISTNRGAQTSGLRSLLNKNFENWPASVRAFHQARIAAKTYSEGNGKWRDIFKVRAPLASLYFAFTPRR